VVVLALKVLGRLLTLPLPSLQLQVPYLCDFCSSLLHAGNKELVPVAFKVLAAIMRHCAFYSFSEAQVRDLLELVKEVLYAFFLYIIARIFKYIFIEN
jgi:hypothetical protein